MDLQQRWKELINDGRDWWHQLNDHYVAPNRFYHTLKHIERMFALFEKYSDSLKDKEAVAFAIYFHDVIYDPVCSDNEEKSAELFLKFAETELGDSTEEFKMKIYNWIIATKTHSLHVGRQIDSDLAYFLDFDLEVLSWADEVYQQYSKQIRQEYSHVPDQTYRVKRAQVLRRFLDQKNLYATKEFRQNYEDQARRNLLSEIAILEAPS